jgi:hypothetical protein
MSRTVLAALVLATFASAQEVRITTTDGKPPVSGVLEGYDTGKYRIRLPNGTLREIDERQVQDVVLVERTAGERTSKGSAGGAQEARELFEKGDPEGALRRAFESLRELEKDREDLAGLAARAARVHFERLLEKRDAAALGEALRRYLPALPADGRRALMTQLAERFADLHRSRPDDAFTGQFADLLSRLGDQGAVDEAQRGALGGIFAGMADAVLARGNPEAALPLYQGAVRVDPARKDALKPKIVESAVAVARRRLDAGDPAGAVKSAREAAALDPANADAKQLLGDADFALVRLEADAAYGAESVPLLRAFIARAARPEQRAWAEAALQRASSAATARRPEVAEQMRRYYPVRPGRWLLYRRADGEIQERIRTDAAVREGDVTKVYFTLQEIYRTYSTTKVYAVEIDADSVLLSAGGSREPLLRFPARAGDAWSWQSGGREFRRVVKGTGETVTVGRGAARRTYEDCLVVEFTSSVERGGVPVAITSRSSYAPGIGLVKLEYQDREFDKFDLELAEQGEDSR